MAQIVNDAKNLYDYVVSNYKEGDTVELNGDEIQKALGKTMYNNALVEIRRAIVFQGDNDSKILIPVRDTSKPRGQQSYLVADKKHFDITMFDDRNVRAMKTPLVKKIALKTREKYGIDDATGMLKMLTVADTLYRRGSADDFKDLPMRLLSICIMQNEGIVIDYYVKPLAEMGFIEYEESNFEAQNGQVYLRKKYKILETEGWIEENKSWKTRREEKEGKTSKMSPKLEKIISMGQKSQKKLLTSASKETIINEDNSLDKNEFLKSEGELEGLSTWLDNIRTLAVKQQKGLDEKDAEIRRLKEENLKLKQSLELATGKEVQAKLNDYDSLTIRAKELIRENEALNKRYEERFGNVKEFDEAKRRVLKRLDTTMAALNADMSKLIEECENSRDFTKIKFKLPHAIGTAEQSIINIMMSKKG